MNKFFLKSGEKKSICTQAPCISSITENVKKIFAPLRREINTFSSPETPSLKGKKRLGAYESATTAQEFNPGPEIRKSADH